MRKLLTVISIFFGLVFLTGCVEMNTYNFKNFGANLQTPISSEKIKVAVLPFRNATGEGGVGQRMADMFIVQLLKTGRFEIIERDKLDVILNEQHFTSQGIKDGQINPSTAASIGKLAGVDAVVLGTVKTYQEMWMNESPPIVSVGVKIVSVSEGAVIWAASETFKGNDSSLLTLVPRSQRVRLQTDVSFLARILFGEMAKTLAY